MILLFPLHRSAVHNIFQGFNPPSYVKMGNIFEILVNILGEKGYNLYILIDIIKLEIIDTP